MLKTLDVIHLGNLDNKFSKRGKSIYFKSDDRKINVGYVNTTDYIILSLNPILDHLLDGSFGRYRHIINQIEAVLSFYFRNMTTNQQKRGILNSHHSFVSNAIVANNFYFSKSISAKIRNDATFDIKEVFFSPEIVFGVGNFTFSGTQYGREGFIDMSLVLPNQKFDDFIFDMNNLEESFYNMNKFLYDNIYFHKINIPFEDFMNNFDRNNLLLIDMIEL